MSRILDEHPEAAKWVHDDLVGRKGRKVSARRGREGMSGEQVLRVLLVKQLGGFSYDQLAFHLADSISYRAFCRFDVGRPIPNKKTLQRNVKKVEATTLERINVALVEHALGAKIDDANKIRVDCTVVETNIHEPSDSSLLLDSVRVLVLAEPPQRGAWQRGQRQAWLRRGWSQVQLQGWRRAHARPVCRRMHGALRGSPRTWPRGRRSAPDRHRDPRVTRSPPVRCRRWRVLRSWQ